MLQRNKIAVENANAQKALLPNATTQAIILDLLAIVICLRFCHGLNSRRRRRRITRLMVMHYLYAESSTLAHGMEYPRSTF